MYLHVFVVYNERVTLSDVHKSPPGALRWRSGERRRLETAGPDRGNSLNTQLGRAKYITRLSFGGRGHGYYYYYCYYYYFLLVFLFIYFYLFFPCSIPFLIGHHCLAVLNKYFPRSVSLRTRRWRRRRFGTTGCEKKRLRRHRKKNKK